MAYGRNEQAAEIVGEVQRQDPNNSRALWMKEFFLAEEAGLSDKMRRCLHA